MGQRALLAQAKGRGYLVARRNANGGKASLTWWRLCRNGWLPYVRVTPRRTYAGIMLDMDSAGVALQPWAVRAVGDLFARYAAYEQGSSAATRDKAPSWRAVGPWSCFIADVRIEAAADTPDAALELAEIALVDLGEQGWLEEGAAIIVRLVSGDSEGA